MTFTNYSPFGAGVAATATLSYTCNGNTTSATVDITPVARTMTSGTGTLALDLFTDAGRSVVFPGSSPAPIAVQPNGQVTVYGFVAPQDVPVGTYTTTLTVNFTSYGNGSQVRTTAFTATLSFLPTCTIQPGTLAFGAYDPSSGAALDAAGTISVTCSRGAAYSVALGAGSYAAGSTRRMAGPGSDRLQYELYSNAGRTNVWSATATVNGNAASQAPITLVVYGRVPPGQLVQAGDYSDVVQSTINF
jgi:spore coat protein U-like protein